MGRDDVFPKAICHVICFSLERSLEKENALCLEGGPKDSVFHSVYSLQERRAKAKRREQEGNQCLCEKRENKVIRHFYFTGLYLGIWKFVKCFQ